MKVELKIKKTYDIKEFIVQAKPRYWEDTLVNRMPDTQNGDRIPCKMGDIWHLIIDVETGIIKNWTKGITGDSIKIEAGYNGEFHTEFEGYITKIGAEAPLVLECEDEMYQLKKAQPLKKMYSSVDLKDLLKDLAPNYEVKTFDKMPLGKFAVNNAIPYKVIEYLKQNYGIRCFFKGKTLYGGLAIQLKPNATHHFNLNRNVRKGGDLVYETKEGRKRWVKAISKQKGTSKQVTYEFGEQGESEITLHAPINLNKEQLKKWAEDYYKSLVYDGYSGSFHSWGMPRTRAGDSAKIIDPNYTDKHRDGTYYISEVVIDINANDGYKRKNTITFKIKDNARN